MDNTAKEMKTAMILGACREIGRNCAYSLAAKNINLILVDQDEEQLVQFKEELAKDSSVDIKHIVQDLTHPNAGEEVMNEYMFFQMFDDKNSSHIDLLVNYTSIGDFEDTNEQEFEKGPHTYNPLAQADITEVIGGIMAEKGEGMVYNIVSMEKEQSDPLQQDIFQNTQAFIQDISASFAMKFGMAGVSICVIFPSDADQAAKGLMDAI